MSEIAVLAELVRTRFLELARDEQALASGLQNAALGKPNKSIEYLSKVADSHIELAEQCEDFEHPHRRGNTPGS